MESEISLKIRFLAIFLRSKGPPQCVHGENFIQIILENCIKPWPRIDARTKSAYVFCVNDISRVASRPKLMVHEAVRHHSGAVISYCSIHLLVLAGPQGQTDKYFTSSLGTAVKSLYTYYKEESICWLSPSLHLYLVTNHHRTLGFSASHQPTPLIMYRIRVITSALVVTSALATHVINVNNHCGQKFTMQVPGHPDVTSTSGGHFHYNGDIKGVIASVGNNCDINGVPCTAAEFSLMSAVSSADITLIPPHKYNHPLRITLTNGQSKYCGKAHCTTAFYQDGHDERYQIQESNNPNSGITLDFC
ncbi:hypothetical protein O181_001026 [Austropuccinia psidii MF-1]|uniref:Uncharacterized protein n=1 Tax=Austropuccinia psidii MF-1 TaxID=1389203 RepID=A0A9Q3B9K1_9BASI|nr:hypothetical protein [Austropuccinia psidii MF-1]